MTQSRLRQCVNPNAWLSSWTASRTIRILLYKPSDESLGYCHFVRCADEAKNSFEGKPRQSRAEAPGGAGVATLADGEVVITKGALAVMAGRAALAASAGVMIQGFGCGDLPSLRHARAHLMAVVTVSLWIMLRMTKSNSKCRHVLWRTRISAQLMTRPA